MRTFTYNQNSQLIRITAGASVIAEYAYDGFGRRVKKTAGGKTVRYHYDYDGNLISETDGAGNPLRDYVYLNGEPAAMRIYGTGAGWYWFLNDHLGTPQKVVDASGSVVWEAGYMPFGEARVKLADIVNNLRFPGQYFDAETGLHYNRHRYYDPDTGRYLTPDPIGLDGGMNLYVYVDGNPVNWSDPYGMIPLDTIWDIANVIIDIVTGDKESLIFDSAAMMIPYLPAGATKVCKVGKASKSGIGRAKNKMSPDPNAQGDHTVIKGEWGNIKGYETYTSNPKNPTGFDSSKRVDITGGLHTNKITGQDVPTPHVHGKDISGGVRPALSR